MKLLSTLALALFGLSLSAQFTMTAAKHTIPIGASVNYTTGSAPSPIPHQNGTGVTWDLSGISGTSEPIDYVTLANSTEPSNFPQANLVEQSSGAENYYVTSAQGISLVGHLITGATRVQYSDHREVLRFPFSYGDSHSGTFSGNAENIQAQSTTQRGGDVVIDADGFGTLILPYGTLNNVLRLRLIHEYIDTFMGNPIAFYTDTIYLFFMDNNPHQVASITLSYANTQLLASYATYLGQAHVTSTDLVVADEAIQLVPNPATTAFRIESDEAWSQGSITDVNGRVVQQLELRKPTQDIASLASGTYFVELVSAERRVIRQLVKH